MSSTVVAVLSAFSFVGGLGFAFVCVYAIDCLSKPIERRRQLELATQRATHTKLRQQVLEKLFPEQFYDGGGDEDEQENKGGSDDDIAVVVAEPVDSTPHDLAEPVVTEDEADTDSVKEDAENDDNAASEPDNDIDCSGVEPCAICIEPMKRNDSIIMGKICRNHICHRHCVLAWLEKHNDCPVCREPMWTTAQFVEAKRAVLEEDPEALAKELAQARQDNRHGMVLIATNQEPDDIVIEELNRPTPNDDDDDDDGDIEMNAPTADEEDEDDPEETPAAANSEEQTAPVEDNSDDIETGGYSAGHVVTEKSGDE